MDGNLNLLEHWLKNLNRFLINNELEEGLCVKLCAVFAIENLSNINNEIFKSEYAFPILSSDSEYAFPILSQEAEKKTEQLTSGSLIKS